MGITFDGLSAQQEFCRITGFIDLGRSRHGDGLHPTEKDFFVEVKEGKGGTANQVRPIRGCVLAIRGPQGEWYVLSVKDQLSEVQSKNHGQHSVLPYETTSLSLMGKYKTDAAGLRDKVMQARAVDKQHHGIGVMRSLRVKLDELLAETKALLS